MKIYNNKSNSRGPRTSMSFKDAKSILFTKKNESKFEEGVGVTQNIETAVFWYEKAALRDIEAQNRVAILYEKDEGIRDIPKAIEWTRKAAESNHSESQFRLGSWYEAGKHLPKNYDEAWRWYQRAVNNDHLEALFSLGVMCEYGRGVQKNLFKAEHYLRLAVARGHPEAVDELKDLYN